jgi:AcrR family transcriptional regulator
VAENVPAKDLDNTADTRERLILTAERFFATNGIESVSLREIARAAGQKKVAAMQYHFGDRHVRFWSIE